VTHRLPTGNVIEIRKAFLGIEDLPFDDDEVSIRYNDFSFVAMQDKLECLSLKMFFEMVLLLDSIPVCWTSRLDLSSTAMCDQINKEGSAKFDLK